MSDAVIEAVRSGALHRDNVSFDMLRRHHARSDDGLWETLGRGRSILTSPDQLDAYLHWYGPMTRRQWGGFLERVAIPKGRLQIIDYGCGPGLACVLLFDHFGPQLVDRVDGITLIEPSAVALRRAEAVLSCYLGRGGKIMCLHKDLDALVPDDLPAMERGATIHLFSNVLDVPGFDIYGLFEKMFRTRGLHRVLATSHHRYHNGGSSRIEKVERDVRDPGNWDVQVKLASDRVLFDLDDGKPAICWDLAAEVLHDST